MLSPLACPITVLLGRRRAWSSSGVILMGGNRSTRKYIRPVPPYPPEMSQGLTWARTPRTRSEGPGTNRLIPDRACSKNKN